jgi:cytochrome c553
MDMKTTLKAAAFIFSFGLLVVACRHESNLPQPGTAGSGTNGNNNGNDSTGNDNNENNDDTSTTNPLDTSLCFERDILPIFRTSCAKSGCHDAASHEEGYVLDSYSNIMNSGDDDGIVPGDASESEIYEAITEDDIDKRMPRYPNPPLSSAQKSLIRRWINEGAQNGTNCAVLCDTMNFAFNAYIQPIFQQNCAGCHNANLSSGGVRLSDHSGVSAVALDGRLIGAIKHLSGFTAMPQGSPKLSDCKIRQVEKWVQAGAPNN